MILVIILEIHHLIPREFANDFDYPIEIIENGANDVIKTYKLYQFQRQYLTKTHRREDMVKLAEVMFDIEMPLIPILADIELRGVEIRVDYANELASKMRAELEEVTKELDKEIEVPYDKLVTSKIIEHSNLPHKKNKYNLPNPLT